jgi:hypothetical protein
MTAIYRNKAILHKTVLAKQADGFFNKSLMALVSLLIVFSSVISSPAYIDAEPAEDYPVMHLTAEERAAHNQTLLNARAAAIDKQLQMELQSDEEGSDFSLLPLLSYIPSERDQGHVGNCWVWAGTGIMEIALNVQLGIMDRLSIQYLDSNYNGGSGDSWAGFGGYAYSLADFYNEQQMIIPWSNINAYYQDYNSTTGAAVAADEIAANPCYLLESVSYAHIETYNVGQETAILNIKNILHQNKGVLFGFTMANGEYWGQFFDFWDEESESALWYSDFSGGLEFDEESGGAHAVLCVGYDDSDPDPAKHCWILLNSWGDSAGRPNGLFRIPMYYDYDVADADGVFNTEWWTIDPLYLGAVVQDAVETSVTSDFINPRVITPATW